MRLGAARAAAGVSVSMLDLLDLLERLRMTPPTAGNWWTEAQWKLLWEDLRGKALVAAGIDDLVAFEKDAARRMAIEVQYSDDLWLVGLGPRFDRELKDDQRA